MSHQPSVVEYFNSRKRPAVDDLKKVGNPNKVLILENTSSNLDRTDKETSNVFAKKLVHTPKGGSTSLNIKPSTTKSSKKLKNGSKPGGSQLDIRKSLFPGSSKDTDIKKVSYTVLRTLIRTPNILSLT